MLPDLFFGCFKIGGHVKGSVGSITVMACVLLAWLRMAAGKQFTPQALGGRKGTQKFSATLQNSPALSQVLDFGVKSSCRDSSHGNSCHSKGVSLGRVEVRSHQASPGLPLGSTLTRLHPGWRGGWLRQGAWRWDLELESRNHLLMFWKYAAQLKIT